MTFLNLGWKVTEYFYLGALKVLLCNLILGLEDDRACSDVCLVLNMTPAALLK